MCGIAGAVSAARPPQAEDLDRMARAIAHRGPDDHGIFQDGPCGLAFRRLSILDLSPAGHQPMTVGPATVVFNGELYNFAELRSELEACGETFTSRSDTEVLVRAYLQWGQRFVERIDGMFAFALWDARTRTLHVGRDRFGKKPLYYWHTADQFVFGSEVKALLAHPECPRELDPVALRRYLAFEYVPTPDCIFKGLRKLPEAHLLTLKDGRLSMHAYYRMKEGGAGLGLSTLTGKGVDEAAAALRAELQRAVERRLVADVPVGIFLSGGIDSAAVTALATRAAGKVKTFSIGFTEGSFDESSYARLVAQRLGTEHHEERLSPTAALDLIPELSEQLDEPFADPSYVPTYLLSKFTRQHVTVALGGDGADELYAGYDTFLAHAPGLVASQLPAVVEAALQRAAAMLPTGQGYMSLDFRLRTFLQGAHFPEAHRQQAWIGGMTPDKVNALLVPSLRAPASEIYAPLDALYADRNATGLDWVQQYYLGFYLRDDIMVKVDRASMAASLEVRSPFLDTRVVEQALALPWLLKLRGTSRKWLLKRALRGLVPDEVLDRKKHGFAIPVTSWLKGPLRPLLEDTLRGAELFEPGEVRRLIDEHVSGARDHRKPLWTALQLELWRKRWLNPSPGVTR